MYLQQCKIQNSLDSLLRELDTIKTNVQSLEASNMEETLKSQVMERLMENKKRVHDEIGNITAKKQKPNEEE